MATAAPSSGSGGRVHSRKSSKPKRSLPFSSTESSAAQQHPIVKKSSSLDQDNSFQQDFQIPNHMQVIPQQQEPKTEYHSGNEEEIDDVEEGEEVEEEINDDEDMLDGNPDDDEEEEEMSPMQIPNPFLGLSPQSITNAALVLAAKANSNSNNQAVSLDEERKQRQQLLLGGGDLMDSAELFASGFGYPPPLKNMLNNLNGSNNLTGNAAAIFQKPDMDIQISSASSSSSGSALS